MVLEHPSKNMNVKSDAHISTFQLFGVLISKERVVWAFLNLMSKYGLLFVDYINIYSTTSYLILFLHRRSLTMVTIKKDLDHFSIRKLARQKQCRRRTNMMKKAYEYSKICNADVCVGIRMRETGQVHILSADPSGFWAFLTSHLVRLIYDVITR